MVADTLRRAHLADGVPWSSMAVLVRSGDRQVPLLRRALTAAGVPVTVAGDELPLADEPGTRPLLMLLRCALRPCELDEQTAAELLDRPARRHRRPRPAPPAPGCRRPTLAARRAAGREPLGPIPDPGSCG